MKIGFIHQKLISFTEKDLIILQNAHEVHDIHFKGLKAVYAIWQGVRWCDVSFSWFGKLHASFAVLFWYKGRTILWQH